MPDLRDKPAQALFIRRHELGLSQEDVANAAGSISQRTVSELERGKYSPDKLTAGRAAALARALNWTLLDLQNATGVDFGLPTAADLDPLADFPAPLYKKRDEIYMPEGLLEAIKLFGDVPEYADLKRSDVQRQLANHRGFDGGPQTAGQWLAFFQANKPWITNKD
jgi:transcriptional regulator with XRE-family HTH domain